MAAGVRPSIALMRVAGVFARMRVLSLSRSARDHGMPDLEIICRIPAPSRFPPERIGESYTTTR
jgi:hypothetical protein